MKIGFLEHAGKTGNDSYVSIEIEGKPKLMINWDKLDRSSQEIFTLLADGEPVESVEKIPYSMRAELPWEYRNQ